MTEQELSDYERRILAHEGGTFSDLKREVEAFLTRNGATIHGDGSHD